MYKARKDKRNISLKYNLLLIFAGIMISTIFFSLGCSGSSVTPREGSIKGKVLNLSGQPLPDALVTWDYDKTRWALTDSNGDYFIDGIGFGDQVFNIEAFGYKTAKFAVHVYSDQVLTVDNQTMESKSFDYKDIKVDETSATNAVISWNTTDYTNGIIEYGESESLGRTFREPAGEYLTKHKITITDLTPEKQYFFKIVSSRENRPAETSNIMSFTTKNSLEDTNPPSAPTGVAAALTSVANQVTVFWAPVSDLDLKGYKLYRSLSPNSTFEQVNSILIAKGQERYADVTVVPGKKYYYRVTAVDEAGNESGYNNLASILVPGDISTEVTWTRANSPYVLAADINVLPTGRINIDAGVEIQVESYDSYKLKDQNKIEITVSGAIVASAGNDLPIKFTAKDSNPEKGYWNGITFNNNENEATTLVNVVVSDSDTGLTFNNAKGTFSDLNITNCNVGISCKNSTDLSISKSLISRCKTGIELTSNKNFKLADSTIVHPEFCVKSVSNDGLSISGCNFLEYTDTGLQSNESGGLIEFTNNLFVSPNGLALSVIAKNPTISYSTFDSPYCIKVSQDNPSIYKNILVADRSVFGEGKKAIEYLLEVTPKPKFGPNNIFGFNEDLMYIGCTGSEDSKNEDILFMKEINGKTYDYRLRQAFPDSEDTWGINRTEIPFE